MRRIFTLLLFISSLSAAGQYNNEWIRHDQTYFKFKIVSKGLYRISKSVLDAAGIGNTNAQYFELWKNGQPVPIYTSSASGVLAADGYIEFWGEGNDGKPDNKLYRTSAYQHSTEISLFTDTAIYFLTANTSAVGLHYTDPGNNVSGNALAPLPYFIKRSGTYYRNQINRGFAAVVGEYVYSSSYDKGEFWSTTPINPGVPLTTNVTGLQIYTGGPDATFRFGAMGDALNPRSVKVSVNSSVIADTIMDYFNDVKGSVPLPVSLMSSGNASVKFENTSEVASDRLVISFFEIDYPHSFSFENQQNYKFSLPASGNSYIEVTNFNYGTVAPVLLNLSNGLRITGDISLPGTVKFVIPAGGERDFVLVSQEAANISSISQLTPKTFQKFLDAGNQGDYLIITNPVLYAGTNGNNPIDQYRAYRASAAGGGYTAKVVEIDELVDQFAFGIKKDPISIKNFIRYARDKFSAPLKYVFIIGRGVNYIDYRIRESDPLAQQLNLVPSFGHPASDNMLSSADAASPIAVTPIGRLSVVRASEVEDYLEKVKEYENVQKNAPNTLEKREWMKNVVHVTGSSDPYLGTVLCNYMSTYKQIIQDTMFGARVSSFCKASTNTVEQLNNERIAKLFQDGIGILTYFGHSSASTLEFNLDNPQAYNNPGKYPVFFVNGCNAGNLFSYNTVRMLVNETLSEKFVLAKQRGGIAFVASTHFGIVNYLNIYLNNLYNELATGDYGKPLGEITRDALAKMMVVTGASDFYARSHAEQITVHGDPSLKMNEQPKPDYVIEEPQVRINPSFVSVAEETFQMKVRMVNIGKSVDDSIFVNVTRQYPDGTTEAIMHQKIGGIRYADSITIDIPIVASRDKGVNKLTVTVDYENEVDEVSEANNSVVKEVFIFEDEARAIFPYEYAIINNPNQKLYASTADPISSLKDYVMEIDTTINFNSSLKVSKTISSTGGSLEFVPGFPYKDSTVYYWRVARVPTSGDDYRWSQSSFVYISSNKEGFNQSHYFQNLKSDHERIALDSARKWKYLDITSNLFFKLGAWGTSAVQENEMGISLNGSDPKIYNTCTFSSLVFNVFDPITFKPWVNTPDPVTGQSMYFSADNSCNDGRQNNFTFDYIDPVNRKHAMDFMDNIIPDGAYVAVRAFVRDNVKYPGVPQAYISDWMKDTLTLGSHNSLYHRLLANGFIDIDSFYKVRPWIFVYKKNQSEQFPPKSIVARGTFDNLTLSVDFQTPDTLGFITSPEFGPAKEWNSVIWKGHSEESAPNDNPLVSVIGIDNNHNETTLFQLDKNDQNFDISSVSAAQYPYMKLKMRNVDSISLTPYQLDYWRIHYTPIPEGALAANLLLIAKDTLTVGEPLKFAIAFKNISNYNFDSLAVKLTVIDNNNVAHPITVPRQKPLISGDTVIFRYEIDSKDFSQSNTLHLEFNPDNDQPEQFHFNNFLFKSFYVITDRTNPLLDVTFDGVHILNKDLVSARPHIQIKLKDESTFLLLSDTSLSTIQVRYPDGTVRTHHFDNDTLRFIPATSSSDNSATIDFFPYFATQYNANGDEYELIVKAKDRSGNKAGLGEYRIAFTVITKAMISNMLNYPNPFSTSTAFVFTLTGSEVPQNMKVQILTVTGKIVKEITKEELGPIRIGRNITEYKWDGTDQFGQKLGNGVYLYRFVTSLNGKRMEKYKAKGDNTDVYFNNGYGKMYLMR